MKKILIAEDSPTVRGLLQSAVESRGYECLVATNGQEALDLAKSARPDLLILDVVMPVLNGFQVCRALKADPELKGIPVLMFTDKSQESDQFWGKETGASEYIPKPADMGELNSLFEKIRGYLGE